MRRGEYSSEQKEGNTTSYSNHILSFLQPVALSKEEETEGIQRIISLCQTMLFFLSFLTHASQ